jgi:hypothetical protein
MPENSSTRSSSPPMLGAKTIMVEDRKKEIFEGILNGLLVRYSIKKNRAKTVKAGVKAVKEKMGEDAPKDLEKV